MSKLELDVPKDAYNVLTIALPSKRVMYIILPSGIDGKDAAQALEELDVLREMITEWQSN